MKPAITAGHAKSVVRRLVVAVGLAVLTAVVVLVSIFNQQNTQPSGVELPANLLFQLRGDDGHAVVSALQTRDGQWLALPADLTVGDTTLGELSTGLDVTRAERAVRDQLGIKVDDSWQLDRLGLSALLDSVDGITIRPLGGGARRHMDSTAASKYVTDCSQDECYKRFEIVWRALMNNLDSAWLPSIFQSVGSSSRTSMTQTDLVALVDKLQQANHDRPVRLKMLDTRQVFAQNRAQLRLSPSAKATLRAAGAL